MSGLGLPGFDELVEIGRGGFGVVYRARQRDFNRTVAIKIISGIVDEQARQRFERERQAMGTVSTHPHIVTIHASGFTDDGNPYLVMEYMSGGSLADRLREGSISWHETVEIGVKLAGALEAAHGAGILHRDIKPDNVLVSEYGEPKLADFGIARLRGGFETQSGLMVTPIYAPPEILSGDPPSECSDVYSLAATLFTLIAGQSPFMRDTDESMMPVLARVMAEPVPDLRPDGVPDDVCRALEDGMAKAPAARVSTAAEFRQRLSARPSLRGEGTTRQVGLPVPAPPPEPSGSPLPGAPPRPRRRFVVAGIAAATVLLLALGALALAGRNGPTEETSASEPTTTEPGAGAPGTSAPAVDDPGSYYTTNGSQPALFPECNGVFGLCLANPVDAATALLGLQTERYQGVEGVARVWEEGPIRLTVEGDDIGSIVHMTASIAGDQEVALGLPEGLVLGQSTMGDVKQRLGEPFGTDTVSGENIMIYINCYRRGPEGSELLEFSYATELGSANDPGGFNSALDMQLVTSFRVGYGVAREGCGPA